MIHRTADARFCEVWSLIGQIQSSTHSADGLSRVPTVLMVVQFNAN